VLLTIDAGNTNVVIGVFEGDKIKSSWRMRTERRRMADEWAMTLLGFLQHDHIEPSDIKAAVISSVVPPLTPELKQAIERYFKLTPLVVEPGIKTGVAVRYENPREVGADRIVNAVAALHYYGGPAIVIDFGTATTFDALSTAGEYLGGAIAPGVGIASEALFSLASRLYRVELLPPKQAIGRNTTASMQSGIMFGYMGLVESMVRRFNQELLEISPPPAGQRVKVIATGGLAEVLAQDNQSLIDVVDQDLTLQGLRLIYELNAAD
jgi:type III pantothenate kinase